jgi:hypothetical protein
VVFPSHYEGFGIPVVESLAYAKPVLARSIPVVRELREKLAARENLILYGSTRELVERLSEGFPKWQEAAVERNASGAISWNSGTAEIGEFLWSLLGSWSFRDHLLPRLAYMRVLEDHRRELEGPAPGTTARSADGEKSLKKSVDPQVVEELKAVLRDKELRVAELENSLSWKITGPLRTLGTIYHRLLGRPGGGN